MQESLILMDTVAYCTMYSNSRSHYTHNVILPTFFHFAIRLRSANPSSRQNSYSSAMKYSESCIKKATCGPVKIGIYTERGNLGVCVGGGGGCYIAATMQSSKECSASVCS